MSKDIEKQIKCLKKEIEDKNKQLKRSIGAGDSEVAFQTVFERNWVEADVQLLQARQALIDGEVFDLREGGKHLIAALALKTVAVFEAPSEAIKATRKGK